MLTVDRKQNSINAVYAVRVRVNNALHLVTIEYILHKKPIQSTRYDAYYDIKHTTVENEVLKQIQVNEKVIISVNKKMKKSFQKTYIRRM